MSVPDYAEMGRELEANRDATLVNAANRGVKYHEELEAAKQLRDDAVTYAAWCEERLEAAERKLATYETVNTVLYKACKFSHALLDSHGRNADRIEERLRKAQECSDKLLAQIEQAQEAGFFCNKCGYVGLPGPKHPNCNYFAVKIDQSQEPPKQQLPGEDPDAQPCQCSACVALREKA